MRNLNVNIENAVLKICGHFSIPGNRRETLKDFNSFADTELLEILRHVSARWLSLLPSIESNWLGFRIRVRFTISRLWIRVRLRVYD